jgi:hypothetical protein
MSKTRETRRSREEMITLSLRVAEYVLHKLERSTPPLVKEVAHMFDLTELQVRRLVDTFEKYWSDEHPEVFATFRNWSRSHRATSYDQQTIAGLAKDMLASPSEFGTLTLNEIASAMGIAPAFLSLYYERWAQKDWPPLPPKASGWIDAESVNACILGDTERLEALNTTAEELMAVRQDLIQQRLERLVWDQRPRNLN